MAERVPHQRERAAVRDLAELRHQPLGVAVLELGGAGTARAERDQAAAAAHGVRLPLPAAQLRQVLLEAPRQARVLQVVGALPRELAELQVPIRVDREA